MAVSARKHVKRELAIGLMSGTSADGVDGVTLAVKGKTVSLVARMHRAYPKKIRNAIEKIIAAPRIALDELGHLDCALGGEYAKVAATLQKKTRGKIAVIGCHGQTICHRPDGKFPFTMQLGDGAVIAQRTGLPVVNDFRRADIAAGGQGAPLAPAFHHAVFADAAEHRALVNLGGIANITHLPARGKVRGFDTGPANTLIDLWCRRHFNVQFDKGGARAKKGEVQTALLNTLLADKYFSRPPPKSTGREYFHADWLARVLAKKNFAALAPIDVLATLTALTAESVAACLRRLHPRPRKIYVCGGGANNHELLAMLAARYDGAVRTTRELGIDPQWVEAAAFAWMAQRTLHQLPSTLPSVTGAKVASIAGVIHYP